MVPIFIQHGHGGIGYQTSIVADGKLDRWASGIGARHPRTGRHALDTFGPLIQRRLDSNTDLTIVAASI